MQRAQRPGRIVAVARAITMASTRVVAWAVALAMITVPSCAQPERSLHARPVPDVLTPSQLRAEVHRRVPELPVEDVAVLFEVDRSVVERAGGAVASADLPADRIKAVVQTITAPSGLGLQYDRGSLGTAAQALERGSGNCLSLAAVLVGVARGLGWRAQFTEMSLRDDEIIYEADVAISEEHMGAKISADGTTLYIDYSGRMSVRSRVVTVSDLRATAQYYSNHAYELLHESHEVGAPVPWGEVAHRFEIATRIEPALAQAWNNLGVARSRLGDVEGAQVAYRRAIELGDRTESAARNLRRLQGLPPEPVPVSRPGVPTGWEASPED